MTTTAVNFELENEKESSSKTNLLDDKALHELIHNAMDEIIDIEEERKSLNANINAIRKKLVAQGICIESFNYAFALYKKDPDDRKGYDQSLIVCQDACGVGFQRNLFKH